MAKNKIEYGNVEVSEEDLSPKNVKWRVTTFIDRDVLDELKKEAIRQGTGYQTLMNQILRERFFGKQVDPALEEFMREIARDEIRKKAG